MPAISEAYAAGLFRLWERNHPSLRWRAPCCLARSSFAEWGDYEASPILHLGMNSTFDVLPNKVDYQYDEYLTSDTVWPTPPFQI